MASLEKIKSGKNFIVYSNGEQKLIKIEGIRFSYPHFGEAKEDESDDGKPKKAWQGVAMLPKATHVDAKNAFMELLNDLQEKNKVKIPPEYRCIKNGDDKDDELMHGHWLISFSEAGRNRPGARNAKGELISDVDKIDETFYGGAWGSVLLRPWFFAGKAKSSTKTYPKRLCCGYNGVQFLKGDTPFGNARIDDTEVWGNEGGESGSDGLDDDGI